MTLESRQSGRGPESKELARKRERGSNDVVQRRRPNFELSNLLCVITLYQVYTAVFREKDNPSRVR